MTPQSRLSLSTRLHRLVDRLCAGDTAVYETVLPGRIGISDAASVQRQEAETAAEKSERWMRLALDSAQMGIWEWDPIHDTTIRSLRHDQIFGYETAQPNWNSSTFLKQVVPEDRSVIEKRLADAVSIGKMFFECRVVWPDQSIHWISVQGSVCRDDTGKPVTMTGTVADITQRKAEEEALAWQAAVVNSSDDAIITKTPDGTIVTWNHGAEKLFGYSASEVVGQPMTLLFPPELATEESEIRTRIGRGESMERFETVRVRKDGTHIDVSVTISPIRDAHGTIVGASKVCRDITERKRSETVLRESLAASRNALKQLADQKFALDQHAIVAFTDVKGTITYVNQKFCAISQYSRQELIGQNHRILNSGHHPKEFFRKMYQTIAAGEVWRGEIKNRAKDGSMYWVDTTIVPTLNAEGKPQQYVAIRADITERKRAEQEIRDLNLELEARVHQRTAQLYESEQRVRRKLESILSPAGGLGSLELRDVFDIPALHSLVTDFYKLTRIPLFMVDRNRRVLVGVGWQKMCAGFHQTGADSCPNCKESDEELIKEVHPGTFRLHHCENRFWGVVTPVTVGGQQLGTLSSGQFLFSEESIDDEVFRLQAKHYGFDEEAYLAALLRVPRLSRREVDAGMAFYMKLAQLLSQLGYSGIKVAQAMTETRRANEYLAASVKELESFTYSVSHDLRAPLRHISGFSKLLQEEFAPALPLEAQHHVQRIQEGTLRMAALVDDLLNLARLGRRDLSLRASELKSMVDKVIAELASEWANRQVEWKIGELPVLDCDPGLLRQVFQNLIANALKFTRPRARAVIEVGQTEDCGDTVVFVRDNGVGFNMKHANKLFGVFQRLHRVEEFEGTGVGLATVQRIVQKHGGRIWVEAEPDKGATFYFTLKSAWNTETESKTKAAMAGDAR